MDENASKFIESMPTVGIYDEISAQKSKEFSKPIKSLADETGCVFFDAAKVTKTGDDGCHLDLPSQKSLADSLESLIKGLDG